MKLWYKKSIVFVLAGISYLIGQYFRGVWFLGSTIPNVCGHAEASGVPFCNSQYLDTLGWPLIVLGQTLAIIGIILLFANAQAFHKWLRFSYWYVPLATLLTFAMYPTTTPLGGVVPITQGVYLFGRIYIIITASIVMWYLVITIIRKIKERKNAHKSDS